MDQKYQAVNDDLVERLTRRNFLRIGGVAVLVAGMAAMPGAVPAAAPKKVALIDQKKCIKCGTCVKKCPVKAIAKTEKDGKITKCLVDPKKCVACGTCVKNCPVKAIAMVDPKAAATPVAPEKK